MEHETGLAGAPLRGVRNALAERSSAAKHATVSAANRRPPRWQEKTNPRKISDLCSNDRRMAA